MDYRRNQRGFTIVELIITLVVIAILAAITVVVYNGAQRRAAESSLKSDLSGAAKQLAVDRTFLQRYPASLDAADDGAGIRASGGNSFAYETKEDNNKYCLTASTTRLGGISFYVTSESDTPQSGSCPVSPPTLAFIGASSSSGSSYGIKIQIGSVSGATDYTLQRSTNSSFSSPMSFTFPAGIIRDGSATTGTTYYYRVQANLSTGSTDWSNTVTAVMP